MGSNDLANIYGAPVQQIVARVNDRVITNTDLTRAQQQLDQESRQAGWSLDEYSHHQKDLLRDLVDKQLLLSKAKQLGLTGDTELIKRLDEIRKQNHLDSLDDLEKAVEQQGTSYEDFKANIRDSIITQEVVRNEVGSHLQISQADIENYYNQHRDEFTHPESVNLNEILIPTSDSPSASDLAAAGSKADQVETELKSGAKFADLAKKYSGGPTAQEGGNLGEFRRGALAKVLEDQTFDLPAGGYTKPIRTKQGYIILQVSQHTPGGLAPMATVEPQIEQDLYVSKIEPAVRKYLTRLREEAYIDVRSGYVDSGASANETKPTYTAYAPPEPKKKKKKARFDRRYAKYRRLSDAKSPQTTQAAAVAATPAGSGTNAAQPAAATATQQASVTQPTPPAAEKRKPKRQKMRYGQAPLTRVSDQQVATASNPDNAPVAPEVQPLGPDLEHNPTVTQPKDEKTRFSDRARDKEEINASKQERAKAKLLKTQKKKKAKTSDVPESTTPAEIANQQVQSAPLGLNNDTAKKKKTKAAHGEKTRLSDEKKVDKKKETSQPQPAVPAAAPGNPDNGGTAQPAPPAVDSGTQPSAPSSTSQPQP